MVHDILIVKFLDMMRGVAYSEPITASTSQTK